MTTIPTNFFNASATGIRETASINWQYNTFYTSSVSPNTTAFYVSINGANQLLVSGNPSQVVSGSITCFKNDTVSFFVSGANQQSNNYILSTLNVTTGSTTLINIQRLNGLGQTSVNSNFPEFVYPLNASGSLIAQGNNSIYNVTASNYKGVNPLCCVNFTTVYNLITYVYTDCNGFQQGITGAGITQCARYGTVIIPAPIPNMIVGANCGGNC